MIETKAAVASSWVLCLFLMVLNAIEHTDATYYSAIAFMCTGNICVAMLGFEKK